jgi:hypothetical protein
MSKYKDIVNADGSFKGLGALDGYQEAQEALRDCVYIIQTMDLAIKDKTNEITDLTREVTDLKKLLPQPPQSQPFPKVAWDTFDHEARGKAWDHRGNAVDMTVVYCPSNDYDR